MKDSFLKSSAVFVGPVGSEGGRSASTLSTGQAVPAGGLAPGQRWSVGRKREVVLRLLRGNQQKNSRENWACRCTGSSAGASARYRELMDRCGNARAMR